MIKTKKYNFGNLLICNNFTLEKLSNSKIAMIKIHWVFKTLKDFKIIVREECENNKVYFYIENFNSGKIVEYDVNDILK